jgi:hypothetical protein
MAQDALLHDRRYRCVGGLGGYFGLLSKSRSHYKAERNDEAQCDSFAQSVHADADANGACESYEDKVKLANRSVAETGLNVVIYHSRRLHVGIDDRGSNKTESTFLEIPADRVREVGPGRDLRNRFELIYNRLSLNETPNVLIK